MYSGPDQSIYLSGGIDTILLTGLLAQVEKYPVPVVPVEVAHCPIYPEVNLPHPWLPGSQIFQVMLLEI
jgi:hypothetical protein